MTAVLPLPLPLADPAPRPPRLQREPLRLAKRLRHAVGQAIADFGMVRNAVDAAKALGVDARVGNLFSADLFYSPDGEMFDVMEKYGILGVEMEAAGIYGVAAEFGAKALTICTVSDHIRTHEQTTAAERQTTFNDMIKIALESVLLGDKE